MDIKENRLMDIINKIKESKEYVKLSKSEDTFAIILIGSLVREDFIDGWSDIDFVIITKNTSLEYLNLLDTFLEGVSNITKLKAGAEIFSINLIKKLSVSKNYPGNYLKLIKNLYADSLALRKGILFLKKEHNLPTFGIEDISHDSLINYIINTTDYMNKFMLANANFKHRKMIFRKLIKNCLLLMQTFSIYKSGNIKISFLQSIDEFYQYENLNIRELETNFSKRYAWKNLADKDINIEQLENAWRTFQAISQFIIEDLNTTSKK